MTTRGTETRSAKTEGLGPKDDGPVPSGTRPNTPQVTDKPPLIGLSQGEACDLCGGDGKNRNHQLWPDHPPACRACDGTGRARTTVLARGKGGVDNIEALFNECLNEHGPYYRNTPAQIAFGAIVGKLKADVLAALSGLSLPGRDAETRVTPEMGDVIHSALLASFEPVAPPISGDAAQADTVAFVRHWMMNGDHEPSQWDRDFAAAIDARSRPADGWQTMCEALSQWKCGSCGGSGTYKHKGFRGEDFVQEEVPCKICSGNGLNPIASAALAGHSIPPRQDAPIDIGSERAAFCNWWRSWCPDRPVPRTSSHIMDAWLARARKAPSTPEQGK